MLLKTRLTTLTRAVPKYTIPSSPQIISGRRLAMSTSTLSPKISLNPTEERFCRLLNGFAQTLDPPVECRIAGGWVRDKVSGGRPPKWSEWAGREDRQSDVDGVTSPCARIV
jgi:hypothetical protein